MSQMLQPNCMMLRLQHLYLQLQACCHLPSCCLAVCCAPTPGTWQQFQLLQVFGSCFTIGGFPPWMLQYAEMYHMGQLQGINRLQVRAQFAKYAGTTQRNGT